MALGGRVVLIGDSNVGKTTLIQRYLRGQFQEGQKNTVGAVFHTKETQFKNKQISLQIWDTAGQERYRALGPVYYRKSNAAIAVFDLTKKETMKSLEGWIETFRQNSDDPFVVIAGNKSDLDDKISVSIEETAEWASSLEANCIWTSAKTGDGIEDVFNQIMEHIFQSQENTVANESVDLTAKRETSGGCCS